MGCGTSSNTQVLQTAISSDSGPNSRYIAKDLKITFDDLKHIDERALKVPPSSEDAIPILAEYLSKPAKNEIEIIRGFYVWICNNISYDTDAYFGGRRAATAADAVLKCRKSVCEGFADLFLALCLCKSITCVKISGFSKGYGHIIGSVKTYNMETDHAWNVVSVNEKWRFIETTWGAGHVHGMKFVKEFSNFYFFTDPKHFIVDHFPYVDNSVESSKTWQLLDKPMSLEAFSAAYKPTRHAREWDVKFSHQYEVMEIKTSGKIIIASQHLPLQNVSFKMIDLNRSPCHSGVLVKESKTTYAMLITPDQIGEYNLSIYGTIEKGKSTMPCLAEYKIKCTSTDEIPKQYPLHNGFYGPRSNYRDQGFDSDSPPVAFQTCKQGELQIQVKTTKYPKVSTRLFESGGKNVDEYVLTEQTNQYIFIRLRLCNEGYYKLSVFGSVKDSNQYDEVLNILVFNKTATENQLPFPKTYSSTTDYKCHLTAPLFRDIPANSNVNFQMTSTHITELLVEGNVYKKDKNDKWNITIQTREAGVVRLSGKTDETDQYWTLYEFIIKS